MPASAAAQHILEALRKRESAASLLPAGPAAGFEAVAEGLRPRFEQGHPAVSARVYYPARARAPIHIEDAASGAGVDVVLPDAGDAGAVTADGFVVYPAADTSGATVLHRALPNGTEDFVSFERRPKQAAVAYQLRLGAGVKGLRLVAGTLEMIDAGGAPRLRVEPPFIVGADGARVDAKLEVEGCAVDTNPAAPWRRSVTAPGAAACTVRVSWNDGAVRYPAVLDPRWTTTGTMIAARQDHVSILLSTGKVLVAGGRGGNTSTTGLNSAELFDPATATWTSTGSMTGGRWSATATQIGTTSNSTSGRVLVAGGINGTTSLSTAQLYTVSGTGAGTWAAAAGLSPTPARHLHTATMMANGNVLVAGGMTNGSAISSAAIFTPASGTNGAWSAVGTNMSSNRRAHSATLLASSNANFNNRVLIAGGNSGGTTSLSTAQLFNPSTGTWSTTTALPATREGHTATALANGNVLITGGVSGTSAPLASTFVFTIPGSGTGATWPTAGTMTAGRSQHTATLLSPTTLSNGQLLVAAGSDGTNPRQSAELWNGTSTWTATTNLPAAVQGHTATRLASGAVLIAGGAGSTAVNLGRVYDPSFALACTTDAQCASGFCRDGVCCDTACNGGECQACNLTGLVGTCSLKTNNTSCTDDGNPCTADRCNGSSPACQHPAGNSGATCATDNNPCTVDVCNGSSTTCQHNPGNPGASCRGAADECDLAETCTGSSTACPADTKKANGTSCSSDSNPCTVDACNGSSVACQHNPGNAGAECRTSAGLCDVAETCTGSSATCPADQLATAGTSCRGSAGACDVAEACTGSSAACPNDTFVAAGTSCRAATGACDVPETCNGSAAACPADAKQADGTSCADGNACTSGDVCTAGLCAGTAATCSGEVPLPADSDLFLTSVWSPGGGDVYASGYHGVIVHRHPNGTVSEYHVPDAPVSSRLWGTSAGNVYFVGGNKVFHSTGDDTWTSEDVPGAVQLAHIWGTSDNDIYVSEHFDNGPDRMYHKGATGTWTEETLPGDGVGRLIWRLGGSGPNDVYAVGYQYGPNTGFILHRTNGVWTAVYDGNTPGYQAYLLPLYDVWAKSASDVYVVGAMLILHFDGTSWTVQRRQSLGFSNIWAPPSGTPIFVLGGWSGVPSLLKSSGDGTWAPVDTGATMQPSGMWGDSATSLWLDWTDWTLGKSTLRHVSLDTTQCDPWPDGDPCTVSSCTPNGGVAQNPVVVDDGNPCTIDSCDVAGQILHAPVVCTASDQCHEAGTCDPATGTCTNPPKDDGMPCSDDSACTMVDTCQAGACIGALPVTCAAMDPCHSAGTCDPTNGICSNPVVSSPSCTGSTRVITSQTPTTPGVTPAELIGLDPATGTITVAPPEGVVGASPGTAVTAVLPALVGTTIACVADMNADGTADIVFANPTARTLAYLPRLDPQTAVYDESGIVTIDPATPQGTPGPAACGDVDGFGTIDVVMSFDTPDSQGATTPTMVVYSNRIYVFDRAVISAGFPSGVLVGGQSLADFDGDGRPDLTVYAANNQPLLDSQIFVFPNSGILGQPFSQTTRVSVPFTDVLATAETPNWGALATLDWDGDGRPDVWALGNRGALFLYRSLGGFTFADPEFDGVITDLPAQFAMTPSDTDGDGFPDLIVAKWPTNTNAGPSGSRLYSSQGAGVLAGYPRPAGVPSSWTPTATKHPPFRPPGTPTEAVGLVKGSPVVSTYYNGYGWLENSVFVQGANGHLLERVSHLQVQPFATLTHSTSAGSLPTPIRIIGCISTICDDGGSLTSLFDRTQTNGRTWTWIDHGTPTDVYATFPHGTIVASQPSVVLDEKGDTVTRYVFVRGLDGHLWTLIQQNGSEYWWDSGLPSAMSGNDPQEPSQGAVVPLVGSPSAVKDLFAGTISVFILDAAGRLDYFQISPTDETPWKTTGLIGKGNCFGAVGMLGEGSPKAITWYQGGPHRQVFVISAEGDLFSWRDESWEESFTARGADQGYSAEYLAPVAGLASQTTPNCGNGLPPPTIYNVCPNDATQPIGCPTSVYNHRPAYQRLTAGQGTPDAVVWRRVVIGIDNSLVYSETFRAVYMRGAQSDRIYEYVILNAANPVPASLSVPSQVYVPPPPSHGGLPQPPSHPPGSITTRGPTTQLNVITSPVCNLQFNHRVQDYFVTDPVAIPDNHGGIHLLVNNDLNHLNIIHRTTSTPSGTWDWEDRQLDVYFGAMISTGAGMTRPVPAGVPVSLDLFSVRSNGTLQSARDTASSSGAWHTCGPRCGTQTTCNENGICQTIGPLSLTCTESGTFTWDLYPDTRSIHAPPSTPSVLNNASALGGRGFCKDTTQLDSIFPQWVSVEGQRTDPPGDPNPVIPNLLYGGPPPRSAFNLERGFESEVVRTVEGVVIASHISAADNPTDHAHVPFDPYVPTAVVVPRVHHDWNIIIAPDIASQDMLSDANILNGGTMELEWEVGDHLKDGQRVLGTEELTTNMVPAVGDRIVVRGRHIFDCGHPPYRTEIHPIDAMAVMNGSNGRLRFSRHGGTTWYMRDDLNYNVPTDHGEGCSLTNGLEEIADSARSSIKNLALFGLGCQRNFDLSLLDPEAACYAEYDHDMKDILPPHADVPLNFDVPGSTIVSQVISGRAVDLAAMSDCSSGTHCRVSIPAEAMPDDDPAIPNDGPATMSFAGIDFHSSSGKALNVCFERTVLIGHDNVSGPARKSTIINAGRDYLDAQLASNEGGWRYVPLVAAFNVVTDLIYDVLSDQGITCNSDMSEEPVIYITANGRTKLYAPGRPAPENCMTVVVDWGDTLRIGAHGFECDMSCAEHWDDDFFRAPDDRVGTIQLAFTVHENFGVSWNGNPGIYTLRSQPDLETANSRHWSAGDYQMTVTISE